MKEVTPEQIKEWKEKYGKVMRLSIGGVQHYYRPIDSDEYLNIQKLLENDAGTRPEMATAKVGTITPEITDKSPAGSVLLLSDEILKISGFVPDGEPEEL